MTFLTSISLESVQSLEEIFAYMTPGGWVVPPWLTALREHVIATEHLKGDGTADFLNDLLPPQELRPTYH